MMKIPRRNDRRDMKEGKEPLPNDGGATFWDHLEVLRWALLRMVAVMAVCTVAVFILMPRIFDRYILAPTTGDFFMYRWLEQVSGGLFSFSEGFSVQIINIHVASQFFTHISISLSLAFVLTVPYIILELWRFIRPALFDHEVRHVRFAFMGSTLMFYLGCMVAYLLVFPFCFRFLTEYELSAAIQNQIDLSSYIGHFTTLILVMGLVFEAENAFAVLFEEQLKDFHCAHGDGNASSVIGFSDFSRNHDGTFVDPRSFHLNDFSDAHTGEAGKDEGSDHELTDKARRFGLIP